MERIDVILARSSLRRREPSPTYNLFRREDRPDHYYVVPVDWAVPTFIQGENWAFVGKITEATALPGFWEDCATSSVRLNGFYLFIADGTGFTVRAALSEPEHCAA